MTADATLDLHYWPTPNGKKVSILLEELGVPYNLKLVNIGRGDQFKPEYIAINPNNRMPTLVDHAPADGKGPLSVFESGAIMMYLAQKTGQFWASDVRGQYSIIEWVVWEMANQGPKTGELGHFKRAVAGDQSYAIRRFDDEVNRIYGVLNNRLYQSRYIAGDTYTIADMICFPWTLGWEAQGQDINEFPHFKRWFEELNARPAVQRGLNLDIGPMEDPATVSDEEKARRMKMLYNQRARPTPA